MTSDDLSRLARCKALALAKMIEAGGKPCWVATYNPAAPPLVKVIRQPDPRPAAGRRPAGANLPAAAPPAAPRSSAAAPPAAALARFRQPPPAATLDLADGERYCDLARAALSAAVNGRGRSAAASNRSRCAPA